MKHFKSPEGYFEDIEEMVMRSCSEEGWDGYDAVPVSWEGAYRVIKLISMLPDILPDPSLTPENDGGMALDWQVDKKIISISWDPQGRKYIFAYHVDELKGMGSFHQEVPEILLKAISKAYES